MKDYAPCGRVILLGVVDKEKALSLSGQGFFGVDKRFEISNLDLIKDMHSLIKFCEVLSIGLKDEGSGFGA
jgi:hypothetical protein